MPEKIVAPPKKSDDPRKTPVGRTKKEAPEPEHVDPPPRDVREAPSPNPNGNQGNSAS